MVATPGVGQHQVKRRFFVALVDPGPHFFAVVDVDQRGIYLGAEFFALMFDFVQAFFVTAADKEVFRAAGGIVESHGFADAGRCAGNENVLKFCFHFLLSVI